MRARVVARRARAAPTRPGAPPEPLGSGPSAMSSPRQLAAHGEESPRVAGRRRHAHLAELLEVVAVAEPEATLLVFELCEGGELFALLRRDGALRERPAALYLAQVSTSPDLRRPAPVGS